MYLSTPGPRLPPAARAPVPSMAVQATPLELPTTVPQLQSETAPMPPARLRRRWVRRLLGQALSAAVALAGLVLSRCDRAPAPAPPSAVEPPTAVRAADSVNAQDGRDAELDDLLKELEAVLPAPEVARLRQLREIHGPVRWLRWLPSWLHDAGLLELPAAIADRLARLRRQEADAARALPQP